MFRPKMAVRHIPKLFTFLYPLLALAFAGSVLLAFRGNSHAQTVVPQVLTNPGNPAIAYAESHWNWDYYDPNNHGTVSVGDGQPNFECSEFTARALSAEGLVAGLNPNSAQWGSNSFGAYAFNGTTYDLNLITPLSGYHTFYDYLQDSRLGTNIGHNLGEAAPGDIVVFSDSGVNQHTAILIQVDPNSTSNSLVDAHNNAAYHDSLADEISGFSDYFIVHIQAGGGGTRGASQTVSQSNGTVDTFFKGTDGALYHAWFNPGSPWASATPMAGTAPLGSEPSAVTSSPGVVDVFWKGVDNNLWHVFYIPGHAWTSPAQSLNDGPLGGAPKAVAQSDGSIKVFWRGQDNNLWGASYTLGGGWVGPQELTSSQNMASDPAPVNSKPGTWDIFWKGSDGNLWHVFQNAGSGWSAAQNLGDGILGGAPRAVGQPDGSIQVVWRGNDNNLWHAWYTPSGGWAGPGALTSNQNVTGDPAPVNSKSGTWDIFWKGSDGHLWHGFQNAGTGWALENLGDGILGGAPVATGQSNGTVDVFWVGGDSDLWHAWYGAGGPWAGPQSLGGSIV